MFACEIPLILLCFFKTIYAVLLLMVGRVVVHLCDHNYSYGHIGGLRQHSTFTYFPSFTPINMIR